MLCWSGTCWAYEVPGMKTEDAWYFNIHNLGEGDSIGCPICKKKAHHLNWQETVVAYDSCPSPLFAVICPWCARVFDYLHDAKLDFQVQKTTD